MTGLFQAILGVCDRLIGGFTLNTNLFRSIRFNVAAIIALVFALLCGFGSFHKAALAAEPETKNSGYAVLIVGDESKPDMVRSEKELISEITKLLAEKDEKGAYKYNRARSGMQVFSYHINHDREKQFCEKKLNILGEDLLFLGVIALNDRLPSKVIYRIDRIVNEKRAAADVFSYAENLLAGGALPVPSVSKAQTVTKTETSSTTQTSSTKAPTVKPSVKAPATSAPASSTVRSNTSVKTPAVSSSQAPTSNKKYAPVPEGKYLSCQVGAFSNEANAKELVDSLKAKGYEAAYRKFERSGGSFFYRVYSGSFSTRADAEAALQRLKDHGFDKAILVTLDK